MYFNIYESTIYLTALFSNGHKMSKWDPVPDPTGAVINWPSVSGRIRGSGSKINIFGSTTLPSGKCSIYSIPITSVHHWESLSKLISARCLQAVATCTCTSLLIQTGRISSYSVQYFRLELRGAPRLKGLLAAVFRADAEHGGPGGGLASAGAWPLRSTHSPPLGFLSLSLTGFFSSVSDGSVPYSDPAF